jgi:hypothetical protein
MLSNAFMFFIFSMNRMLREPAIQPLIHHLEDFYAGAHPPTSSSDAPPTSPTASHSTAGTDTRHGDTELNREVVELEHQLREKRRQLAERQRQRQQQPREVASPAPSKRDLSTSPAPVGRMGEGGGEGEGSARADMAQQMEQAIFNDPLQISAAVALSPSSQGPHPPTAGPTAHPVLFHSSYHGETADQLRNRGRQSWDSAPRFNSASSYGGSVTSVNRPARPHMYPPSSVQSPIPTPPHFVPSTAHTVPQIPAVTPPPPTLHHQSTSQEWTEYASAPVEGTPSLQGTVNPTPLPANQGSSSSQKTTDVLEFDPLHS